MTMADRFLIAAAAVFGLALGNHSLTTLLIVPVALYVIAVDPAIWRRPRLVLSCVGVLALTVLLVYLELPLRAGPFRAPLVYGTPETWEGFKYIVLAEQFRDSVIDPFGDLPRKFGDLVTRTSTQFGIARPAHPDRVHRDGAAAAALRAPDRDGRGDHLLLRIVVRQCRHQSLLPRAGTDGLDVAGDRWPRPSSTSWLDSPARRPPPSMTPTRPSPGPPPS